MNKFGHLKRLSRLLVLIFFTFLTLTSSSVAHADSSAAQGDVIDNLIPNDGSSANYNQPASRYQVETVNPDRGALEIEEKAQDSMNAFLDFVVSGCLMITIYTTKFFIFIAQEAFEFRYFNLIVDVVVELVQNLTGIRFGSWGDGLWGDFIGVFIQITIVYILFLMIKGRFLDGMSSIASFLIALAIILAFFTNLGPFLKGVNSFGEDLNNSFYITFSSNSTNPGTGVGNNSSNNGKGGVSGFSRELWTEVVDRPYQMMQFDSMNVDPTTLKKVLNTEPDSEDRTKALKDAEVDYPHVAKSRTLSKFGIVIMNGILSLIILICFSYFAFFSILGRLKALYQSAMMSFTLFAALLPGRGGGVPALQPQFIKLIGSLFSAVMGLLFLDISLVLGHGVFTVVHKITSSWFVSLVIETITILAGFYFRKDIAGFLVRKVNPGSGGGIQVPQRKPSVLAYSFKRKLSDGIYDRTVGKAVSTIFGGNKGANKVGMPRKFNPLSLNNANKSLDDATAASMSLRYHNEKTAAEDVAASSGEPVQYTPFVSKVNENLENGMKNPFRGLDKEWKTEKDRLASIKSGKGNMKDAILTRGIHPGMNDQQVASVMYANESAIRQTGDFFKDRPKEASQQIKIAKKLQGNEKLKASMDDFAMMQLYKRYKQDQRDSVQQARKTGERVQQTPFVQDMNLRFKTAGLHNASQIKTAMSNPLKRASIISHFSGMPEFSKQQTKLLDANESLNIMTRSTRLSAAPAKINAVSIKGPLQSKAREQIIRQATGSKVDTVKIPYRAHIAPELNTRMDMSKVKIKDTKLQSAMREKSAEIKRLMVEEGTSEKLNVVNTKQVQMEQAFKIKNKMSSEITEALRTEKKSLTIMNKASKVAEISDANINVANNIKKRAVEARCNSTSAKKD
ncbi:CD3337/EF1877 family mobilome membrane protein [Paenibacillus polymyxa]|uniref:CD3337/EF1877 family mobilome membrane protein n=1 Tax=Paenibacillus polymyxa TaxID=1406 RepID=UPI0018688D8B|nr:hypothetical protein [Paenibacillus polymyxa]MBE3650817.1 hypothetical protein [Paenibacillus polymyxa]